MSTMEQTLAVLKKSASRFKGADKKKYVELIDGLSTDLVLLKLSSISAQVAQKLTQSLRDPLVLLYNAFPLPALQFSASVFHTIYYERVMNAMGSLLQDQQIRWERVLHYLLSGVLDFLDKDLSDKCKEAIASAFYVELCDVFFSLTATMIGIELRCTAYSLLCDSSVGHKANQDMLRDPSILGGERLGAVLFRTKDYLPLEQLLNIFARLLPSVHGSDMGRVHRTKFIQSVFIAPWSEMSATGNQLAAMMENVPTKDWEVMTDKIFETLADASITFPQPFSVDTIVACGKSYPSNRLYLDDKEFCANVPTAEDQYDSLDVLYPTIRRIDILSGSKSTEKTPAGPQVTVYLKSPPAIGKTLQLEAGRNGPTIIFTLDAMQAERFLQTLKARGLHQLIKDVSPPKLSLPTITTILEFDSRGRHVPELSQTEREHAVASIYGMIDSSDGLLSEFNNPFDDIRIPSKVVLSTPTKEVIDLDKKDVTHKTPADTTNTKSATLVTATNAQTTITVTPPLNHAGQPAFTASLKRTESKIERDAIFGASDEELSELSDAELTRKQRVRQGLKTSTPCARPKKSSADATASSTAVPVSCALNNSLVLASDDEDLQPVLRPTKGRKSKKIATVYSIETEDGNKLEALSLPVKSDKAASARRRLSITAGLVLPSDGTMSATANLADGNTVSAQASTTRVSNKGKATKLVLANDSLKTSQLLDEYMYDTIPGSDAIHKSPPIQANEIPGTRMDIVSGPSATTIGTWKDEEEAADKRVLAKRGPNPLVVSIEQELANQDHHSLVVRSSSPIPMAKISRPIKANLRKKDEKISDKSQTPAHVSAAKTKRKRIVNENDEPHAPSTDLPDMEPPPVKRRRSNSSAKGAIVLAATRVTKRYKGKKGRTSSPVPQSPGYIDFDELPGHPPVHGREASSPTPALPRPNVKGKQETKVKPNAPARRPRVAKGKVATATKSKPAATKARKQKPLPVRKTTSLSSHDTIEDDDDDDTNVTAVPSVSITIRQKTASLKGAPEKPDKESDRIQQDKLDLQDNRTASKTVPSVKVDHEFTEYDGTGTTQATSKYFNNDLPTAPLQFDDEQDVMQMVEPVLEPNPKVYTSALSDKSNVAKSASSIKPRAPPLQKTLSETVKPIIKPPQKIPMLEIPIPVNITKPPVKMKKIVTMIDLTHEDSLDPSPIRPPVKVEVPPSVIREPTKPSPSPSPSPSAYEAIGGISEYLASPSPALKPALRNEPASAKPKYTRPRQSVTFASPEDEYASLEYTDEPSQFRVPYSKRGTAKPRSESPALAQSRAKRYTGTGKDKHKVAQEDITQAIVDVLDKIHQVVIERVTGKVEMVKGEFIAARARILAEAAADLRVMEAESAGHYNTLIDLEAEYSKFGRRLADGYDDVAQTNRNICSALEDIIADHDRNAISKKLPQILFSLPPSLQKFMK